MQDNLDDKVEFMQRLLNWKAERDEIEKSEKRLQTYVDDALSGIDRFADKEDVTRRLVQIDNKVRRIYHNLFVIR